MTVGVSGNPNWYLRVTTRRAEYLLDVGPDAAGARTALRDARRQLATTGTLAIGAAVRVSADEVESIALQDARTHREA